MRPIASQTLQAWKSPDKTGVNRPTIRATVQRLHVALINYDIGKTAMYTDAEGKKASGTGQFASVAFGQSDVPVEIPNLTNLTWTRDIDQDVASATLTLANTEIVPVGTAPVNDATFDRPGWFTPGRGGAIEAQMRWGDTANAWNDRLVPDAIVRTYEGYGFDAGVGPEDDPHMYLSGTWLIDSVALGADATITIQMRDIGGKTLLDQIMYPPIVPWSQYPLSFQVHRQVDADPTPGPLGWVRPAYEADTNVYFAASGLTDGGKPIADKDGSVRGHKGRHAFDNNPNTYWLSTGYKADAKDAFPYIQGRYHDPVTVKSVKVKVWGGPYTIYVSLWQGHGKWLGAHKIPYIDGRVDTSADQPFVVAARVAKNAETVIKLPKTYEDITQIRLTFSHLYDSGIGSLRWRAGLYDMQWNATNGVMAVHGKKTIGNYSDYSEIVKWLLAWAGYYWPDYDSKWAFLTRSDGEKVTLAPDQKDPLFPYGRVWGDFESTGTYGPNPLGQDNFDQKPVMDGISYIRDIIGFVFFTDEWGGAIWRSPNYTNPGNYITTGEGGPHAGRTADMYTIDEKETLTQLTATLSSANVRERIFVGNTDGKEGAVAPGYNPYPSGLRRVGGWTDENFTQKDAQRMADLITIRQMLQYRVDSIIIPANPGIQIDDQIRIYERVTNETHVHYVKSISMNYDIESGQWTYQLGTYWLGEPRIAWIGDFTNNLSWETRQYLNISARV